MVLKITFIVFFCIIYQFQELRTASTEGLERQISRIEKINQVLRNRLKDQEDIWTGLQRNLNGIKHTAQKRQSPDVSCGQPVVFSTRLSKHMYPLGKNQIITYDDILTNTGGGYDKVTGIFEAPYAGLYQVIATMWSNDGYSVDIEMIHNGTDVCFAKSTSTNQTMGMCASVISMQANDRVWVRHLNNIGNYAFGNLYATFSGHRIM